MKHIINRPEELIGKSILIVDDIPDNRVLIEAYLKNSDISIDVAANGLEALEMVKAKTYALLIMDIQMPILDGVETTTILRMRGFHGPIIACTAFGLSEITFLATQPSFDAFLAKPFMKSDLLTCLNKLVEHPNTTP